MVSKREVERIIEQQPPDERFADPGDELDHLGRLQGADDAGQHAEHTGLGAGGKKAGRRRIREEIAVGWVRLPAAFSA